MAMSMNASARPGPAKLRINGPAPGCFGLSIDPPTLSIDPPTPVRPVNGQSQPPHHSDHTNTTHLLTAVSGCTTGASDVAPHCSHTNVGWLTGTVRTWWKCRQVECSIGLTSGVIWQVTWTIPMRRGRNGQVTCLRTLPRSRSGQVTCLSTLRAPLGVRLGTEVLDPFKQSRA
jgi:hypothetical protein